MKVLSNEFYLKILIMICGVIYWIYGAMPTADNVINLLYAGAFVVIVISISAVKHNNFNKTLFFLILVAGTGTIVNSAYKKVTLFLLFFICVEIVFLSYCSESKSEAELSKELQVIAIIFIGLSAVVVLGSLYTYMKKVSGTYSYPGVLEANLILGKDKSTGALVGVFSNANAASSLYVEALGFTLYMSQNRKYRVLCWIYTVVLLGMVYLTRSRGGLVGAVIVMTMYIFVLLRKLFSRMDARSSFTLCFLVAVAVVAFSLMKGFAIDSVVQRSSLEMGTSTATRKLLWQAGIKASTSNLNSFFFGVGGNIKDVIIHFVDKSLPNRLFGNMHNIYMQTLVEFGIFGLLFLVVAIARYVGYSFKMLMDQFEKNKDLAPLIGLLASLLIISFVESDIYLGKTFLSTVFWIIGGYVYQIERRRNHQLIPTENRNPRILYETSL